MSEKRELSTLYLVSTPIGNLQDITLRAIEALSTVDVVASEDTRRTGMLLKHLGIKRPQVAFHEHNEQRAGERLLALLREGKSVALVSNAGTPVISDPGYTLVRDVINAGLPVTTVPGPTAFVPALILSGLPTHSFLFRGFPPRKAGARRKFILADAPLPYTLIYYESPYRLSAFLKDALDTLGDRKAAVVNDLTKRFESVQRGKLSELLSELQQTPPRGEYVVVIEGFTEQRDTNQEDSDKDERNGYI